MLFLFLSLPCEVKLCVVLFHFKLIALLFVERKQLSEQWPVLPPVVRSPKPSEQHIK